MTELLLKVLIVPLVVLAAIGLYAIWPERRER